MAASRTESACARQSRERRGTDLLLELSLLLSLHLLLLLLLLLLLELLLLELLLLREGREEEGGDENASQFWPELWFGLPPRIES